jgi:hypothetical protein
MGKTRGLSLIRCSGFIPKETLSKSLLAGRDALKVRPSAAKAARVAGSDGMAEAMPLQSSPWGRLIRISLAQLDRNIIGLNPALDITTSTNANILNCAPSSTTCLKTIRISINLLGDATTGVDMQTNVRPVITLMGDARLVNNVGNNY